MAEIVERIEKDVALLNEKYGENLPYLNKSLVKKMSKLKEKLNEYDRGWQKNELNPISRGSLSLYNVVYENFKQFGFREFNKPDTDDFNSRIRPSVMEDGKRFVSYRKDPWYYFMIDDGVIEYRKSLNIRKDGKYQFRFDVDGIWMVEENMKKLEKEGM